MIGIVVITWNSGEVIAECLDACQRLPDTEILVVDNASSDDTTLIVRARPGVRLIENSVNRGFAGAANQGIGSLRESAVLLLNPDAMPSEGVSELATLASAPGIGAAGGRLVGTDGRPQEGFYVRSFPRPVDLALEILGINQLLPWNPFNYRYRFGSAQGASAVIDVDQPAGAFLMVNRAAWEEVGGFDEEFYPLWFEDVDFCKRLKAAGHRILYVPYACARHIGSHSASRLTWEQRQLFWYRSLVRYSEKHYSSGARRLVGIALILACVPRAILGFITGHTLRGSVCVYSKVFWLAVASWQGQFQTVKVRRSTQKEENRARQF